MSRATDKLLELLFQGSAWSELPIPPHLLSTTITVDDVTDEMTIVPESEHGPMLRIAAKTKGGTVLHTREMNLSAVDGMIGKLIQMRDAMAKLKGTTDEPAD